MSRSRRKWPLLLAGIAIVAAAGGGVAWRSSRGGPDGIEVETEPASRRTVVQTVSATGRIQPKTQVNISADVSAKIIRLAVAEGDRVERGDLLLELDSGRYVAAVESAEANLRVAQANAQVTKENLTKAERDFDRVSELFRAELETLAALDAAVAARDAERARERSALDQVDQVRAGLKQARDDLSKTRIYAPIDGTVSRLNKEAGEIALGSQFQEDVILELSNLGGMEALVDVDENDVVLVSRGDPARIEVDALPGVVLAGTVTDIANSAKVSGSGTTDQKTEFEVKISVEEPETRLRPGMTATAEITTEVREEVLAVPIQSVAVRTPEQLGADAAAGFEPDRDGFVQIVFVVEEGRALARQVRTGIQSDTHIEILEGLDEGAAVVTGSYRAISKELGDGAAVVVAERKERAP